MQFVHTAWALFVAIPVTYVPAAQAVQLVQVLRVPTLGKSTRVLIDAGGQAVQIRSASPVAASDTYNPAAQAVQLVQVDATFVSFPGVAMWYCCPGQAVQVAAVLLVAAL